MDAWPVGALLCELMDRPGWRNWQTQRTQNPPRATSWGFDPPSRHHDNKRLILNWPLETGEASFVRWLFWWLLVLTVPAPPRNCCNGATVATGVVI